MTQDHSSRAHSLYSASSSARWLVCPGSIQRVAGMPVKLSSTYAQDGEEAHELLEYALAGQYKSAREAWLFGKFQWTHHHDNEETRIEAVQTALDHIMDLIDAYQADDTFVALETQFIFPTRDGDDCGGTCDVIVYIPGMDMMIVADYKHGTGVSVNVKYNSQLLFYAVGARQELRRKGMCTSGKTLYRLVIMQPRGFNREGGIREWMCDDHALDDFVNEVNFAIIKSKETIPEIVPGKHCRWCPAISACPEAEVYRMSAVIPTYTDPNSLKKAGLPKPGELSVERIADILTMRDMVDDWFNAVEGQAIQLAKDGVAIPGKKLVYAQAKSKWAGDERTIANTLGQIAGVPPSMFYKPRLTTITEAKETVKQAIYERVGRVQGKQAMIEANQQMAPLTTKASSGNLMLVDREDKRPEVNTANLLEYKQ